jgi:hypothetical protein
MTTTDTRDVAKTVEQVKRCADAGADIVRITVQGKKEAEACMRIREQLFKDRCGGRRGGRGGGGGGLLAGEGCGGGGAFGLCSGCRAAGLAPWRACRRRGGAFGAAPTRPGPAARRGAHAARPAPPPPPTQRYDVPLVADIHFQPAVAMMVAEAFEKVRLGGSGGGGVGRDRRPLRRGGPQAAAAGAPQPGAPPRASRHGSC